MAEAGVAIVTATTNSPSHGAGALAAVRIAAGRALGAPAAVRIAAEGRLCLAEERSGLIRQFQSFTKRSVSQLQVQQEKIIRENRFQGGRKSALSGCNSHFHMYAKTQLGRCAARKSAF